MSVLKLFETKEVRSEWDAEQESWYFSIVDVVSILTDSVDAAAYWRKLKQRLKAEGNQTVTDCHGLKMPSPDGKMRLTDVASTEQLLRLIQSVPSPKAEPFKQWLARVGYERIEETDDPELAFDRSMFIEWTPDAMNMHTRCKGTCVNAVGNANGRACVKRDLRCLYPTKVETFLGNPSKGKQKLGSVNGITVHETCSKMVKHAWAQAKEDALINKHGDQLMWVQ